MQPSPNVPILDRLRQLLANADGLPEPGGSMVQGRFAATDLTLSIADLGALSVPPSAAQLAALQSCSRPAPYGLREQTRVDPSVRDTGEIDASALDLRWAAGAEARLCTQIAEGLGLERVELKLHKLLIYGPGQFFKPHQDTARQAEMLGTLVLIWPSAHRGGDLSVYFGDSGGSFSSQQRGTEARIRWCAFYADCRHEVLPVTEGHRIALSFEVRLPVGVPLRREAAADPALTQALARLFGSGAEARRVPWCVLLDHQYNELGLRWRTLKGRDQRTAQLIRAAAEATGYRVGLLLIEQMEVRDCAEDDSGEYDEYEDCDEYDAQEDVDDADEEDDGDGDQDVPADIGWQSVSDAELLDCSYQCLLWLDAEDRVCAREPRDLDSAELAALNPTGRAHLVKSEYEGYMGNYGETMNYWYRRAAVMVQSPQVALRTDFQVDPAGAAARLAERAADPARLAAVRAELQLLQDLLNRALEQNLPVLPALLEVASTLTPTEATGLLSKLNHGSLDPACIPALLRLQAVHGVDWLRELLPVWTRKASSHRYRSPDDLEPVHAPVWPEPIDQFLADAAAQGLDPALIGRWQAVLLAQFVDSEEAWRSRDPIERERQRRAQVRWMSRMLRALAVTDPMESDAPLAQALRVICANPLHQLPERAELILVAGAAARLPLIAELRGELLDALQRALAEPIRPAHDQGLRRIEWVCRCELCAPMIAWAESASAASYVVGVAEKGRRHLIDCLRKAGAPIETDIIRRGSPYQLRCDKTGDAEARDAQWRALLAAARDRLQAVAP
ncbi:MAG: 2OG-Fe(II) oxygenase [Xanthomonadales bacterium]|jgi:hypothetical protein|nr:2OG-Fe(II) oxygenase [Xanthomonadales bacterium]